MNAALLGLQHANENEPEIHVLDRVYRGHVSVGLIVKLKIKKSLYDFERSHISPV